MKHIKKIVSFVLCVLLLGLAACSNKDGSTTRVVFTTGPGKNEIFRVGDNICSQEQLMIYLTTTQNQYEDVYGKEIWQVESEGITLEQNVKETVLERIAQVKTMYLLAKQKNIELTEDEVQRISRAAEEYYLSLNATEIDLMQVSQKSVEELYTEYALANKVYFYIIKDINPEISDDEARTITVQHIMIRTYSKDANGQKVFFNEGKKQEIKEKMLKIRDMSVNGNYDFAELAAKYSEDNQLTYSFGKGDLDLQFETAAFLLETDEISPVIESESGYHIIKCLNTFDREETDANKLQIVEKRRNEAFGLEYDEFVETLARRLNKSLWDKVELIHNEEVRTTSFFTIYEKYFPEED